MVPAIEKIRCAHCSSGHDLIATTADNTKKNNVLELS
jgi:hypothetical protein